ncbi:MAG: hypothetical protein PUB47_07400 [Bacteroides sp.]|nr:hypothetical protein [Bacteroides sp.]
MKLSLNLLPYQRSKLFLHATSVRDIMFVFLTALEYIQYWRGNPKALKRPYLLLDLEDTRRVFLVDKDKIISFGFRLNVKTQLSDITDPTNFVSGIYLRKYTITAREISEAKQILNSCSDKDYLYCYSALEEDTVISESTLYLFEHLLFSEWGYLRYDHDPSHAVEGFHPSEHLDVCFSHDISYKLGLKKVIEVSGMIDLINQKTRCAELIF